MATETDQRKGPERRPIWKRLILLGQEGVVTFTDEQKQALEIRGLAEDLSLAMGRLLYDQTLDTDPEFRARLLEECGEDVVELGRLGVSETFSAQPELASSESHIEVARYAASLLIGEEFETIPNISTVIPEFQRQSAIVVVTGNTIRFRVSPKNMTPALERWRSVQGKMAKAFMLLDLA